MNYFNIYIEKVIQKLNYLPMRFSLALAINTPHQLQWCLYSYHLGQQNGIKAQQGGSPTSIKIDTLIYLLILIKIL